MSNYIPRHFINELIARCDIVELIHARLPLKKRGANYLACCPFHSEKTPSFTVSPNKQIYHCFGCAVSGNCIGFIMAFEHVEFVDAIEILAAQCGLTVPYEENGKSREQQNQQDLFSVLERVKNYYQQQLLRGEGKQHAMAYLKKRGLSIEIIKRFALGFAPPGWDNLQKKVVNTPLLQEQLINAGMLIKKNNNSCYDRFRNRIMFPIYNQQGRIIGFGGRTITDEMPKYLNSPETTLFHKGNELYSLYHARQTPAALASIIIVEGYMDVLALSQVGITHVVATLGTAITTEHIRRLLRYTSDLVFCFDGDAAGQKAAWRALETLLPLLQDGMQARFIFLPEGQDPDSIIQKEGVTAFKQRIQQANSLSEFFFQQLSSEADLSTLEGRANLKQRVVPLLNKMPDSLLAHMMKQRLAAILRIDLAELTHYLAPKFKPNAVKSVILDKNNSQATPLNLALMLLVQYPYLKNAVKDVFPVNNIELKESKLWHEIFIFLQQNPDANTASIIEHFRDSPYSHTIMEFATYEHLIPADGIHAEFTGVIERLSELEREQKMEYLLSKANQVGLSNEEKKTLQDLITEKHVQG
jgi:DNA primase